MGYPESFITIRKSNQVVLEVPISYETLAQAVRDIEDTDENVPVFEALASHPASDVRQEVAAMSRLNKATVHLLAADPSVEVARTLVLTEAFEAYVSNDEIMALIDRDTMIAVSVAEKFDRLENVDAAVVLEKLLSIDDPMVGAALAGNDDTPKRILLRLKEHPEPLVRARAMQTLA